MGGATMQSLSEKAPSGSPARLLTLWIFTVLMVALATTWVALNYSNNGAGYWPGYNDMMASLPSPISWLRWVLGDISEVAFYKHELASLGLLLGGALGYWASRYAGPWQGFSICYGTGLWPWLVSSSLLGLLLSNALWGWTLTADTWQPTFAAFVSLPAAMVLFYGGGWKVMINGAILGALLVTPACLLIVNYVCLPLGLPVVVGNVLGMAVCSVAAFVLAMQAFASPNLGPAGMIIEHRVHFSWPASARKTVPWPVRTNQKVALLEAVLAADNTLVEQLVPLGYEGLVIAGFGAGHVSEPWSTALEPIAAQMPVIVSTRCGAGSTAFDTYGFKGGEIDLINKGLHMSGCLCPRKARILLWLLIGSDSAHALSTYL